MAPKRIRWARAKGWRKPEGAIYVGRPTRWGNPWVVGQPATIQVEAWAEREVGNYRQPGPGPGQLHVVTKLTAEQAVALYRGELEAKLTCPGLDRSQLDPDLDWLRDELAKLAGHDLGCWCPLDQPCHADVLLEFANRTTPWTTDLWMAA